MSSFCNVYQQVLKNIPAKLNFLEYNEATNMIYEGEYINAF